ncbi:MAG: potassium channel protein [Acidobacteria bacterium]|jgi:voltage-gated potassium channel|nr:MAG: potassium channel protein [Acidobacteriota bacterium]
MTTMLKTHLHRILEGYGSTSFLVYHSFSFAILLLSVILGLYDESKGFHSEIHPLVLSVELFVSAIILFEYLGRLYLAKDKLKYLIHPLSILDLIALVPFFQPFRLIRFAVLLARFIRITYRYRYIFQSLIYVFTSVLSELAFAGSLVLFLFFLGVTIIYSIEKGAGNPSINNPFDAVYMVIITMTTVGYGDITPITWQGRFVALVLAVGGLISFSALVATLSAGIFRYMNMVASGTLSYRDMKDHIVICGWNETASVVIERLKPLGKSMVLVTTQEIPERRDLHYKRGDFGSEEVLLDAGVERASMVIILAEKLSGFSDDSVDARTILSAMQVRDLNHTATIIVELLLRENAKLIRRKGIADYIIVGGEFLGVLISKFAQNELFGNLFEYLVEKTHMEVLPSKGGLTVEEVMKELDGAGYKLNRNTERWKS